MMHVSDDPVRNTNTSLFLQLVRDDTCLFGDPQVGCCAVSTKTKQGHSSLGCAGPFLTNGLVPAPPALLLPPSPGPSQRHQSCQGQEVLWFHLSSLSGSCELLPLTLFWLCGALSPSPLDLWLLCCLLGLFSWPVLDLLWVRFPSFSMSSSFQGSCLVPQTHYTSGPGPRPETHIPGPKGHAHQVQAFQKHVYRPHACLWDRNAMTSTSRVNLALPDTGCRLFSLLAGSSMGGWVTGLPCQAQASSFHF